MVMYINIFHTRLRGHVESKRFSIGPRVGDGTALDSCSWAARCRAYEASARRQSPVQTTAQSVSIILTKCEE